MALKLKQYKRVAIVHDVLIEYGGAEKVLVELMDMFPEADLYTFFYNSAESSITESFGNKVKSSFLSSFPGLAVLGSYFSIFKLISWVYFYFLDLSQYDLIISSSHSYNAKIVRKKGAAKHVAYIHTPPRYLYGLPNQLSFLHSSFIKILLYPLFVFMKRLDFWSAQNPDLLVANSQEVKKRIIQTYKRKAEVVYPPVMKRVTVLEKKNKRKYYVAHSRLVKHKGFDLIIAACTKYSIPLVVIGDGYLRSRLQKNAGRSISFTGYISKATVKQIYAHARALLYAAKCEDFGIVPVEAQAFGVPVVAYASGGVKETVLDKKTGIFFNNYSEKALIRAILKLEQSNISSKDCIINATRFSKQNFRKKIKRVVYET